MEYGWNILWFIVGVSLLVTVHEYGHYWVARRLGFKVLRFSVGFGKPLYKRVGPAPDHTEFVIAAIPLGGYVRMLDEREGEVPAQDRARSFQSKAPWQRILVMLAGPAANIVFAILVLWGIYWVDGVTQVRALVDKVEVGKPAERAGLRPGDELLGINGAVIRSREDAVIEFLDAVSGDGVAVLRVRDGNRLERDVTLRVEGGKDARRKLTEQDELYRGLGFEYWEPRYPAILGTVDPAGPAARSGLKPGDEIKAINGTPIRQFREFMDYINARPGESAELTISRKGVESTHRVDIVADTIKGRTIGRLFVQPVRIENPWPPTMRQHHDLGPIDALGYSFDKCVQMTAAQAKFFWRILTFDFSWKNISGPFSIAGFAGDAASAGVIGFLWLLVLLSLSLGFLNLLPIPILDGGQIVFQIAEWVKGRPLSDRAYIVGQQAGLLLLMMFMGLAFFNDLKPYFEQFFAN
jgi:regulator of sigma E protease